MSSNNLYELLGVDPEAGESELKKAYRRKALKCHPDKNPDDPRAAEQFRALVEALAVLTDPKAKKAHDGALKARKANELRNRQLDTKRKKLVEDLEAREAAARDAEAGKREVDPEEAFRTELERLRKEGMRQMEEAAAESLRGAAEEVQEEEKSEEASAKVKVRWKAGSYDEADLRRVFSKYGEVGEVIVMEAKRVGLVEMRSGAAARLAAEVETGFADRPVKVKLLEAGGQKKAEPSPRPGGADADSFDKFESLVMRQMRQTEERKRLEEEIRRQDRLDGAK